ncbi:hypothetical protein Tco_0504698 [Tanacetum coccineum]
MRIEVAEQTNTRFNVTNATHDFKVRNLGRPKNRQLGERNAEMNKNRHKEVGEWNTIVGIIKEPDGIKVFLRKNTLNGCNSGHNKREARKINLSTNEVPKITDAVQIKKLQIYQQWWKSGRDEKKENVKHG